MTGSARCFALLALGIVALVWAVFGQTAQHSFVDYDDDSYVYDNPYITRGLTAEGLKWAFTQTHSDNWHPLTTLSHMADWTLLGSNAGRHHLVNVLLHAVTSVLCLAVFWRMTGALWASAFIAAIFAIHPLHVESVAWVAERKDVLSGLFFMLTLASYVGYVRQRSLGRYLLVVACFCAGLLSKSMLVTVPLVLLLLDYWPLARMKSRTEFLRVAYEKLPLCALSLATGVATLRAQQFARKMTEPLQLTAVDRLENAVVSVFTYIQQTLWPARLAVFYPHPGSALPLPRVLLAGVIIAAITAASIKLARRCPYLLVGWGWYLVMLLPVIGIIQVGHQAHADRYTYLPQIGLVLAGTWLAASRAAPRISRAALAAAASAAVIVLAVIAHRQVGYWRNSETLWRHARAVTSGNYVAEYHLGHLLMQRGRMTDIHEAIAHFQAAISARPDDAAARTNLAVALFHVGRAPEAFGHWEKSLALKPDNPEARNNLGLALLLTGRARDAVAMWESNLASHPDDLKTLIFLSWVLATHTDDSVRDGPKALALATQAERLAPPGPSLARIMAAALAENGRFDEATTIATRAREDAAAVKQDTLAQALQADLARYAQRLPVRSKQEPLLVR